jgi:hypothetical protein
MNVHDRLILAVYGEFHRPTDEERQLDELLHRIGQARRQVEDAHAWLDLRDIPRQTAGGETLTLRGRLELMADREDRGAPPENVPVDDSPYHNPPPDRGPMASGYTDGIARALDGTRKPSTGDF